MPNSPRRDASFVIRIWWEREAAGRVHWRGQATHAQTSQSVYFEEILSLVAFLERWAGELQCETRQDIVSDKRSEK